MSSNSLVARSVLRFKIGAAALYAATAMLGAFLLFALEPMFVKMALPRLGGSSEVWTACVLAYQTMLLGGYAYAHALLRLPRVRDQAVIHGVLCALALLALPLGIPPSWHPQAGQPAVSWLFVTLVLTAGLPFFVLSATSPLMQAWFAFARPGRNPYALYAASNAGSLIALALYPFVVEPVLGLHAQSVAWTWGYVALLALFAGCAAVARGAVATTAAADAVPSLPIDIRRTWRWIAWAFVPSSLMLSVTTYLSERVAPIPLLWTLPLGVYLLAFIIVFGTRAQRTVKIANRVVPLLLMPLLFIFGIHGALPALAEIVLQIALFAAIAIVCHGALAQDRPEPSRLTEFYLYVALGGMLGGVFNSIVAPLLFPDIFEYAIALVLACFALTAHNDGKRPPDARLDYVLPAALAAGEILLLAVTAHTMAANLVIATRLAVAVSVFVCYTFVARPVRFGLGVAALLAIASFRGFFSGDLHLERNFYGVKRVQGDAVAHVLSHGHTIHGAEDWRPGYRRTPQTYYTRGGPLGDIFRATPAALPAVAVVGLGAGSTACYRKPGAAWTFYEIDPGVVAIARNPRYFRYLSDCAPDTPVVVGDARLSLAAAKPAAYDMIVLDAYASDAIPTHLLTREAMRLYRSRLRPHGSIVFHISNAYFDFAPLVTTLARDERMIARMRSDDGAHNVEPLATASSWMIVVGAARDLGPLAHDPRWIEPSAAGRLWTDDYSSVAALLRAHL